MTSSTDPLVISAARVRNAQDSVDRMREHVDSLIGSYDLHWRAVSTLLLLEASLVRLKEDHATLSRFDL